MLKTVRHLALLIPLTLLFGQGEALARILRVGPHGEIQTISQAAQIAQDGDIVEIESGEWHGDVAVWMQKTLTIRGIGQRPVLHADGKHAEGKAIWVIRDGNFLIENIEFRGARVPDTNGAGIRFEAGKLNVRNCVFIDNQNGILTGNNAQAELTIVNSLFAQAPHQSESLPHLLYTGHIARLSVSGSRFHGGYIGHLIKSRARETDLRYNLIMDGENGRASYEVDLPNGGQATLLGNVIVQSEQSANPVVVAFGAEGNAWENSSLTIAHNTFISMGPKPAWFIRAWRHRLPTTTRINTLNNLFSGYGLFDYGLSGISSGNWPVPLSSFEGRDTLDFHLNMDSWLRGMGSSPELDGSKLQPEAEFSLPVGTRKIQPGARPTPGAYQ
jgi:hypothetical protein